MYKNTFHQFINKFYRVINKYKINYKLQWSLKKNYMFALHIFMQCLLK